MQWSMHKNKKFSILFDFIKYNYFNLIISFEKKKIDWVIRKIYLWIMTMINSESIMIEDDWDSVVDNYNFDKVIKPIDSTVTTKALVPS